MPRIGNANVSLHQPCVESQRCRSSWRRQDRPLHDIYLQNNNRKKIQKQILLDGIYVRPPRVVRCASDSQRGTTTRLRDGRCHVAESEDEAGRPNRPNCPTTRPEDNGISLSHGSVGARTIVARGALTLFRRTRRDLTTRTSSHAPRMKRTALHGPKALRPVRVDPRGRPTAASSPERRGGHTHATTNPQRLFVSTARSAATTTPRAPLITRYDDAPFVAPSGLLPGERDDVRDEWQACWCTSVRTTPDPALGRSMTVRRGVLAHAG